MPTKRGFVQRIEIGRAGLASIWLIHDNGTQGVYVIDDLDADPERFNERLSKLAILRDAMDRAEPVEIEHIAGESGQVIDRAARISRDALAPVVKIQQVTGLILDLQVHSENGITATGEKHDTAQITLLTTSLGTATCVLDLQAPERLVAAAQLSMLHDAQKTGSPVRLLVDVRDGETPRVVAVAVDSDVDVFGGERAHDISGFVESVSLIRLVPGGGTLGNFANVRFTTAPNFTGPGNVVGLGTYTPQTLIFLVSKNSPTYDLFVAGLRDNLRMRVSAVLIRDRDKDREEDEGEEQPAEAPRDIPGATVRMAVLRSLSMHAEAAATPLPFDPKSLGVAFAAELLAPLASASRPVWIDISRETLDHGPDGYKCTPGVPSHDLSPLSLRDLRLPYSAVWQGLACFNEGVYRFQFRLDTEFIVKVDGKELCLYDGEEKGVKMAHACLGGDHVVTVELDSWTCDHEFIMDVFRLR